MFGPSGSGAFSVGLTGGGVVVVVVVVGVVSSGVSLSLAHPAVKPIIAMTAPPPTNAATRRVRADAMVSPFLGSVRGGTPVVLRPQNRVLSVVQQTVYGPESETWGSRVTGQANERHRRAIPRLVPRAVNHGRSVDSASETALAHRALMHL